MDITPNLRLPYILEAQAQKHVTHNEAIRALDAIVQIAVLDRDLSAPPLAPLEGSRYIVAPAGSGAWSGKDAELAAWQDGAWAFFPPQPGWLAWLEDEATLLVFDGSTWIAAASGGGGTSLNPATGGLVGVNATADTTNRLSVAAAATLLNHAGNGHQLKLNKALAADTASVLYQTGFSGRAEFGTTGDDDFHVKVSADGTVWNEAIVVDKVTGEVSFPNTTFGGGGALSVNIQTFTATGTYTPTANMVACIVEAVGGGGGGAGSSGNASFLTAGGGGGGGGYARSTFTAAEIGASKAVEIGAAGAAGGVAGAGGAGGSTTFGSTLLVAPGGSGGSAGSSGAFGSPGNGGTGGTGDVLIAGMVGSWAPYNSGGAGFVPSGSSGGHSKLGSSARPITSPTATATSGLAASPNTGGGGSGGMSNYSAISTAGGAGGSGLLIVTEFIQA